MQRSKTLALLALIGALVVGGAMGFTVDRLVARDACTNGASRQSLQDYLADRLALTAAQRASVDSILDKRHRDMSAVVDPIRPRLDSIRLGARAEIFKVLDPPQRARFQQIIDESQRAEATHKR